MGESDEKPAVSLHKRAYGKGLHDGEAVIIQLLEKGDYTVLAEKKRDILLNSCSSTARKVYEAVPVEAAWDIATIISELRRLHGGQNQDYQAVQGTLNSLVNTGLIKEKSRGMFMREPVRLTLHPVADAGTPIALQEVDGSVEAVSPLIILALKAQKLRELGNTITLIAIDIENVALEIEQAQDSGKGITEELTKLRAFRDAFKNLQGAM